MAKLSFTKMHGCGNDYIYVIADRVRPADPGSCPGGSPTAASASAATV